MKLWTIASDLLAFAGGLALTLPALHLSRYLRTIQIVEDAHRRVSQGISDDTSPTDSPGITRVEELTGNRRSDDDPGPILIDAMRRRGGSWNRSDHLLLIWGLVLIVASFALELGVSLGWLGHQR